MLSEEAKQSAKRKLVVGMAVFFSAMMLTACGGTNTEMSDWWYDQRWESAASESME